MRRPWRHTGGAAAPPPRRAAGLRAAAAYHSWCSQAISNGIDTAAPTSCAEIEPALPAAIPNMWSGLSAIHWFGDVAPHVMIGPPLVRVVPAVGREEPVIVVAGMLASRATIASAVPDVDAVPHFMKRTAIAAS